MNQPSPVRLACIFAAASALASSTALAMPVLHVTQAWSRPAAAGTNGIGYLTVSNSGPRPEMLVRVETPLAERVEMHATSMTGGVMRMAKVDKVTVPAGGKATFGPDGYHLMLMGLKKPLAIGDKVPATLTFASGARVRTDFSVEVMPPVM